MIPSKYALHGVRGGLNVSLPLLWNDPAAGTQSFVVSMIDLHPIANNWVHWFVVDIPASCLSLAEGASGNKNMMPAGAIELRNTYGQSGYGGPRPPKGSGRHEYLITVYALSTPSLKVSASASAAQCQRAMKDHIIGSATVSGFFEQ